MLSKELYQQDKDGLFIELQGVVFKLPDVPENEADVLFSELPIEDQKWTREDYPEIRARDIDWFTAWGEPEDGSEIITWEDARRQEIAKQKGHDIWDIDSKGNPKTISGLVRNPDYVCEAIASYRDRHLDWWDDGVWIAVQGKLVYLTGAHWFYLQWWKNDNGYPFFVWEEAKDFYHHEFVKNSPVDIGRCVVTQRARGKSSRMACRAYQACVRKVEAHVTGQGRNDDDAMDFFVHKIAQPYKHLPDFAIPEHNSTSTNPTVNLVFSPPARSGRNAFLHRQEQREALNSLFDYKKAGEGACDKLTLTYYWCEEPGKTDPNTADVRKRHNVVRQCLVRNSIKIGMAEYATTVEELEVGGVQFETLYNASDPFDRNDNGETESGLLQYFMGALENSIFDEYGFSVIDNPTERQRAFVTERYGAHWADGSRAYHERQRRKLKDKNNEYIQWVQKFPYTIDEAFMFGGKECVFDAEKLQTAQQRIIDKPQTVRGDFVWENGEKDSKVIFVENKVNGKCYVSWRFNDEANQANNVGYQGTLKIPKNNVWFAIALDPFSNRATMEKGSDAGLVVRMKFNPTVDEQYHDSVVVDYVSGQRTSPEAVYEDVICIMHYFSARILVENNKGGESACTYFKNRGYEKFIALTPQMWESDREYAKKKKVWGVTAGDRSIEYYVSKKKDDVVANGHKHRHLRVVKNLLEFDPANTTKYDIAVADCWACVEAEQTVKDFRKKIKPKELFDFVDHSGAGGEIV